MRHRHQGHLLPLAALILTLLPAVFAQSNAPVPVINMAGSFNDWSPTNSAYRLSPIDDQTFGLITFFTAGRYKFKFTFDGGWTRHLGDGPGGVLVQPGKEIPLKIAKHGAYQITLDLAEHRWTIEPSELLAPHPVVTVHGPVELNVPVTLDASESVAREGEEVKLYMFAQDPADPVKATLVHPRKAEPVATVTLPKEGAYHFQVSVNDGLMSAPEPVTLTARTSYQIVGDWTADDPASPATFLTRAGPTAFERVLASTEVADHQLILIKNHNAGDIVGNLTASVTQTNRQLWRARYDEKTKQFRCEAEPIVEFAYRPNDDPILKDRVRVETVTVAGSFNGWSATETPMTDRGEGTYVAYLKLDDGLYHYKFLVNGDAWMQDPNSDPALRVDDGHAGFNSGIYIGEQGKDFGPPPPDDINLAAVRHHPDSARDFNVVASDMVDVRLRTLQKDATSVVLHLRPVAQASLPVRDNPRPQAEPSRRDAGTQTPAPPEILIPMHVSERAFGFDYWSASVFLDTSNKTASYTFTLADGPTTKTFDDAGKPFTASLVPKFSTPDWAKHVVWYQIFPERFRNGTTENDPPHTLPWRWDWYKFAEWEHPNETKTFSGDWYSRRFGGDLQGVMEKLPYFHELGVTALYLCPVFECTSNHGYDTVDYRHVNRYFGVKEDWLAETLDPATWKWTASDKLLLEFIKRAHAQGLKVIIDGVFNHMGKGSFAMQDLLTNGVNSAYADWFDVTDFGPPVKYKSWGGSGHLPNFRKDPDTGIASETARKYICDITRRWMAPDGNPTNGVDGWRLDVAPDVPAPFWIEWRKVVKGLNPVAYITGEDWGVATQHLQGDQWDAVMNYQFAMRAVHFFIDQKRKVTASEFDRQLRELLAFYPLQADFVMQNLYDSHDTDRLANMITNPDRDYDGCNRPQDGCPYDGKKPGKDAYRVLKLMATFQMTFLGAPMIWYGDEAGMFGADDPTDRKPMLWKDLQPYDNSQDAVMDDVWQHYARLIAIRNTYPALRTGMYQAYHTDDTGDVFGFTRTRGDQVVAVLINNSAKDLFTDFPVPFPNDARVVDLLTTPVEFYDASLAALGFPQFDKAATARAVRPNTNAAANVVHGGKVRLKLAGKSAAILVRQ